MSVVTLEIDGKACTGVDGETIFDVAWSNGVKIPRLCHIGGLPNIGACRLCVVEVVGQKKLAAACITPVPELVTTNVVCAVPNSSLRPRLIRRNRSRNSGLRWPIIGRSISRRISGRTHVGPGTKNVQRLSSLMIQEGKAERRAMSAR